MTVVVAFPWRTEPAVILLNFSGAGTSRADVPAVISPIFPSSWIHAELVVHLRRIGGIVASGGSGKVRLPVSARGESCGYLTLVQRTKPLPLRLERGGTRAQIMLGLDFLGDMASLALTR